MELVSFGVLELNVTMRAQCRQWFIMVSERFFV